MGKFGIDKYDRNSLDLRGRQEQLREWIYTIGKEVQENKYNSITTSSRNPLPLEKKFWEIVFEHDRAIVEANIFHDAPPFLISLFECFGASGKLQIIHISTYTKAALWISPFISTLDANPNLTQLKLSRSTLNQSSLSQLSTFCSTNKTITTLHLRKCKITHDLVFNLVEMFKSNTSITDLSLSHNNIKTSGANLIALFISTNFTVQRLNIKQCEIGVTGAISICRALSFNNTLRSLAFDCDVNTFLHSSKIFPVLMNNSNLTQLDLGKTRIASHPATLFYDMIRHNTTLLKLKAALPQCTHQYNMSLAQAVCHNTTLISLHLKSVNFETLSNNAFCLMINQNSSLLELNVKNVSIETCSKDHLFEALQNNVTLRKIGLSDAFFRADRDLPDLFLLLKTKPNIKHLTIHDIVVKRDDIPQICESINDNPFLKRIVGIRYLSLPITPIYDPIFERFFINNEKLLAFYFSKRNFNATSHFKNLDVCKRNRHNRQQKKQSLFSLLFNNIFSPNNHFILNKT